MQSVDGFSVLEDPDRVRRRLGFMPDFFGTYANVDVARIPRFLRPGISPSRRRRRKAIGRVMEFTRLDMLADKPIQGLSKGMKQRLCLGRTLIHDPPVLVLDEPAAGLDPRARIELREMIRALANEGKTILISSHILTELAEMCDVVGIIERGRLIAVGSVEEIHQQGRSPLNLVEVRLLDAADGLCRWLAEQPGVTEIHAEGERLRFLYAGEPEAEAQLLRAMILAGFRVIAFGTRRRSLEDVFMQVTQGFVQ